MINLLINLDEKLKPFTFAFYQSLMQCCMSMHDRSLFNGSAAKMFHLNKIQYACMIVVVSWFFR